MVGEFIVNELKIKNQQLFLYFRGLGEIYVDWLHTFPTRKLSPKKMGNYLADLPRDPVLSKYAHRPVTKAFQIVQIDAPISDKELLPPDFLTGGYTQLARWRTGIPGSNAVVDEKLADAIRQKNQIDPRIASLEDAIEKELKGQAKSTVTRRKNELNKIFSAYDGTNFEEIKKAAASCTFTRTLSEPIIAAKKEISDLVLALDSNLKSFSQGRAELVHKDRNVRITLDSPKYFGVKSPLSADELRKQKWCFLDTEKPMFDTEDEELSWAGLCYWENGKIISRRIYTLRKTGFESIGSYKLIQGIGSEKELVRMVADDINQEDPFIIAPFNAPYDLLQLRAVFENQEELEEVAKEKNQKKLMEELKKRGFDIGARGSVPKIDVAVQFMQRINVYSRQVFDLFRWSQAAFKYLPNQKLQMVAKHLLGDAEFEKLVNYDEMKELERLGMGRAVDLSKPVRALLQDFSGEKLEDIERKDLAACVMIATYLAGDVDILPRLMFETEAGRKAIDDYAFMSGHFLTELTRIVHSPNASNSLQDKLYFENVGIFREKVFPKFKSRRLEEQKGMAFFEQIKAKLMGVETRQGAYKNVYKAFIPHGDFLRDEVAKRFPKLKEFYDYKYQFLDDPQRQFFLSQFANAFSKYLVVEYGIYNKLKHEFEKQLEKANLSPEEFRTLYWQFESSLSTHGKEHLRRGTLKKETARDRISCQVKSELESMEVPAENFVEMMFNFVKMQKRERQFGGNFALNIPQIDIKLAEKFGKVRQFLASNNIQPLHSDGKYIYFTCDPKTEESFRKAPFIVADKLDSVYIADKPYYKRHGYFKGINVKEGQSHILTSYEMETLRDLIETVLQGDLETAIWDAFAQLDCIESGKAENKDLVMFNKTKRIYTAFEDGKKIYFRPEEQENAMIEEGTGRKYCLEVIRKKPEKASIDDELEDEDDEDDCKEKIYIMQVDDFVPDFEMYSQRLRAKLKPLVKPILGERMKDFLSLEIGYSDISEAVKEFESQQ